MGGFATVFVVPLLCTDSDLKIGGLATVLVVPLLDAPYDIAKLVAKVMTSAMKIARNRLILRDLVMKTSWVVQLVICVTYYRVRRATSFREIWLIFCKCQGNSELT
jgi:hypothetical protein